MYESIDTNELKALIGSVNIIDIRDNYLYRIGSVPTSKNIPVNFLIMNPGFYLNKDETYYIYCSYGSQSTKVCSKLVNQGFKVINIIGGYNDYVSKI